MTEFSRRPPAAPLLRSTSTARYPGSRIEEEPETVAAILDRNTWIFTTDTDEIYEALENPDVDIVVGETREEVLAQLEQRYEAPAGMSMLDGERGVRFLDTPRPVLTVSKFPFAQVSFEEALELARKHGPIVWVPKRHYTIEEYMIEMDENASTRLTPKEVTKKFLDLGFLVVRHWGRDTEFRIWYSPKAAKRRIKREANRPMSYTKIRSYIDHMIESLPSILRNSVSRNVTGGFIAIVGELRTTVGLINATQGENAHRKLHVFQDFRAEWNRKLESNREKHREAMPKFVAWMEAECQAEAPAQSDLVHVFSLEPVLPW